MTPAERERLVALHRERFAAMGYDPRTVGWGDRESQRLRFEELCAGENMDGASVCDVGCGFGDLADFLRGRCAGVDYTGIDLSPELVAEAARRHPGDRFEVRDLLENPFPPGAFDHVLCSGALSVKLEEHERHVGRMLGAMFGACRVALAVNFLSDRVDYRLDKDFHFSPARALEMGLGLSRFAAVRHDYPLFEFTLVIRRGPRGADHPGGHKALRASGEAGA